MKRRNRSLLVNRFWLGFLSLLMVVSLISPPPAYAASGPLTLTYTKVNAEKGQIKVTFGTGVKRVLLPNGTTVTQSTTIDVNENGVYDFVAYDANNRPTQQQITVSGLDVDAAPLTIAHGLNMKLHVDVFDTISGVEAYRYKLDNAGTWSSWIPYKNDNSHDVLIPTTNSTNSFMEERSMMVEVKDKAGNVRTTQTSFRVDHYYPEIQDYSETIYTRTGKIYIPLVTTSYFKSPEQLKVKEGTKETTIDLTKLKKTETLLSRRPNRYKTDWGNNIPYQFTSSPGMKNLELVVSKFYTDFKGNRIELSSGSLAKKTIKVVYDTQAPTGTIRIDANEKNEVPSQEVNLLLTYNDDLSGVEQVRVYEGSKEYYLTQEEIKSGKLTLPWVLSVEKDGQVFMDVTDKAGNTATFASNIVTVNNFHITGFTLTDVVNPAGPYKDANGVIRDFPVHGLSWQFNGNQVRMIAGGSFSFKLYYSMGLVDPSRYVVSGTYKVTLVEGNQIVYTSYEIPYTQGFDGSNPSGDPGFMATFHLPSTKADGQVFKDGTMVYLTSTLKRVEKSTGKTDFVSFEDPDSLGNLIGIVGHYEGARALDDMVRFNQRN